MNRLLGCLLAKIALVCPGGCRLRPMLHRWRGVKIGKNVWIGLYVYIDEAHPECLTIGDNCTIGIRTSILTHFYWGRHKSAGNGKVVIHRDVFIGPHCVILPNVTIGEGSVIRAGTVVTHSVPPHTFWGAPAATALATVSVPLTSKHGYRKFLLGLKQFGPEEEAGGDTLAAPKDTGVDGCEP